MQRRCLDDMGVSGELTVHYWISLSNLSLKQYKEIAWQKEGFKSTHIQERVSEEELGN